MTDDMAILTVGSLFSGIGGLDLGLERAGMKVIWQSENDPYCSKVLTKHWPDVPNLGDITTIDWTDVERPDVLCGGFPCQPVSVAGKRRAQADDRWLWYWFARSIRNLSPSWVLIENVPGLRNKGLNLVLCDLASLGYDAEWDRVYASWFDAWHRRSRLIVVAYPSEQHLREQPGWGKRQSGENPLLLTRDGSEESLARWVARPRVPQSYVARTVHGLPQSVDRDRWRVLGNAVVPQMAEWLGGGLCD